MQLYQSYDMLCTMRISAVIPCYNEEESIGGVIQSIPKEIDEIIVVDNSSTDRTAEISKNLGATVVFESKQGYGAALKAGFKAAAGEIIVTLDGDGQYPAGKILEIAQHLRDNNLDFISANRFPLTDKGVMTRQRVIGNTILTFFLNLLFGLKIKDSQSGMWIFKRSILDDTTLESDDMPLSEELKIKVARNPKYRFAEYHIPYYPRGGESKLFPMRHGFMNLGFLFKLRLKLLFR